MALESRPSRRQFIKGVSTAIGAAAVGGSLLVPQTAYARPRAARRATPLAKGVSYWGIHAEVPHDTPTTDKEIKYLENLIGKPFAIERNYSCLKSDLPGLRDIKTWREGRIPYRSFHSFVTNRRSPYPWRNINMGLLDTWLIQQAVNIRTWGQDNPGANMFLCFHHEPENDAGCGNAADFKAAWQYVRQIFDDNGVTNVQWVFALSGNTYRGKHNGPEPWTPDPATFDYLGVDVYNRGAFDVNDGWQTFATQAGTVVDYADQLGKRIFVGEVGCVEDTYTPDYTRKAAWILDTIDTVKSWGTRVATMNWSHIVNPHFGPQRKILLYWLDSSPDSLDAIIQASQDPFFK